MRVLAIDQSMNATASVLMESNDDGKLTILSDDYYRPKCTGIYRLAGFKSWLNNTILTHKPDLLVRELHNQVQYGAASQLQAIGCILDIAAYNLGYMGTNNYCIIPVTTWKKFITGKGNLKKDTAYLVHINKWLKSCKFFDIAKDVEYIDDNLADAICLGLTGYAAKRIQSDESIKATKQSLTDLRKSLKTIFDYGENEAKK